MPMGMNAILHKKRRKCQPIYTCTAAYGPETFVTFFWRLPIFQKKWVAGEVLGRHLAEKT